MKTYEFRVQFTDGTFEIRSATARTIGQAEDRVLEEIDTDSRSEFLHLRYLGSIDHEPQTPLVRV